MYDLSEIIPQSPPMQLIDHIQKVNQEKAICVAKITAEHIFYDAEINGVYVWVGIEMMAQASAVLAYFQGDESDHAPRRGFMISVRNFNATRASFDEGDVLTIVAHKEFISDPLGVFLCEIYHQDQCVAKAKFSAYQPSDTEFTAIIQGKVF
ncbi:ApeP family dehydratase [Cysteiniphilum halobium]|uniref:ApeP family dehydratase n=1 Tax=Cysteiniphilum halobium TaxID=2219059 RepID=UPI003F85139D